MINFKEIVEYIIANSELHEQYKIKTEVNPEFKSHFAKTIDVSIVDSNNEIIYVFRESSDIKTEEELINMAFYAFLKKCLQAFERTYKNKIGYCIEHKI